METTDLDLVRAGWMFRQSSILKRWKKNWFTLSLDGMFRYFTSPDDHMAEEAYEVMTDLQAIRTEKEIGEVSPPEGLERSCLLELMLDDSRVLLCAESPDDMSAWRIALEQALVAPPPPLHHNAPPPPYSETYPPQQTVVYAYPDTYSSDYDGTYPPPYVVQTTGVPGQQQQVVYVHDQRRRQRDDGINGGDMAVGMLAGATMGTLLMGPMMFW